MCVCVSMPEVPSLWETACICVDLPRDTENISHQLTDAVHDYGRVMSHRPLQITSVSERPAALLVHWAEVLKHTHIRPRLRLSSNHNAVEKTQGDRHTDTRLVTSFAG